jgi:hypothetical protein
MDKRVIAIADLIVEGDAAWRNLLVESFDCIKELKDYKLIETLLMPINPGVQTGANLIDPLINGVAIGTSFEGPGSGTAYALTDTAAAINLGTDDPVLSLVESGKWLILAQVHLAAAGATVVAETATLKVRRTNNTPADVSQLLVVDLPVMTTLTHSLGTYQIPPFFYTAGASSDSLTIFGNVSAALGAGAINAVGIGTSILGLRVAG